MGFVLQDYQTTLRSRATLTGTGVHSGKPVTVNFLPADADTGVVFLLSTGSESREFRALVAEVGATDLCTMLGDPAGEHIATVEHLMATLFGLGIDNIVIEIDGHEVPILDGSAVAFVEAIDQAGIETLAVKRRYIRVVKPVRIENGASWAEFRPYSGTRFEVEIDFESPAIGRQLFASDINPDVFRQDIARARTFGFMKDVERLWAAGYALGSSLENSLVIGDDNRVINMGGLRYPNEFARHKTMDAMGDLALAGARFIGCFRSYRGGHRMNAAALRRLLSDRSAFEVVETTRRERGRTAEMSAVTGPVFAPWVI
ncbi:UDP-3-O-acyl-N-acetylglucosamine deacetylase [Mesorhizobium sp. WSM4303]|uniref:UDP-3-O-acyl-N-acetylglucosamine deacetylase n=1 Tax=unclassified Mesorhizobium TaxID=325217 RepID=UPI00115F5E8F|nr:MULTISPECIES: UDP-3-O-acyl-N-acetylglucosamine deacetylase [unclassified Mesorhizobium]TRD00854.1 UDP-3-O-acyl-N-acetylglucosamine deacetylase [Mesorhizobium sp. WSM4306]TRD02612.1 UDP-3-O-acyl-N-acetylglucosamine deacetylase [Mesorhizobium sp. WSM4303]